MLFYTSCFWTVETRNKLTLFIRGCVTSFFGFIFMRIPELRGGFRTSWNKVMSSSSRCCVRCVSYTYKANLSLGMGTDLIQAKLILVIKWISRG